MAEKSAKPTSSATDGRVTDTKVIIDRRSEKGGFGWGMLFGVLVIAAAIIAFAYSQGSFQQAGVEADQATAQIEQSTESAAEHHRRRLSNETPRTPIRPPTRRAKPRRTNPSSQRDRFRAPVLEGRRSTLQISLSLLLSVKLSGVC